MLGSLFLVTKSCRVGTVLSTTGVTLQSQDFADQIIHLTPQIVCFYIQRNADRNLVRHVHVAAPG